MATMTTYFNIATSVIFESNRLPNVGHDIIGFDVKRAAELRGSSVIGWQTLFQIEDNVLAMEFAGEDLEDIKLRVYCPTEDFNGDEDVLANAMWLRCFGVIWTVSNVLDPDASLPRVVTTSIPVVVQGRPATLTRWELSTEDKKINKWLPARFHLGESTYSWPDAVPMNKFRLDVGVLGNHSFMGAITHFENVLGVRIRPGYEPSWYDTDGKPNEWTHRPWAMYHFTPGNRSWALRRGVAKRKARRRVA